MNHFQLQMLVEGLRSQGKTIDKIQGPHKEVEALIEEMKSKGGANEGTALVSNPVVRFMGIELEGSLGDTWEVTFTQPPVGEIITYAAADARATMGMLDAEKKAREEADEKPRMSLDQLIELCEQLSACSPADDWLRTLKAYGIETAKGAWDLCLSVPWLFWLLTEIDYPLNRKETRTFLFEHQNFTPLEDLIDGDSEFDAKQVIEAIGNLVNAEHDRHVDDRLYALSSMLYPMVLDEEEGNAEARYALQTYGELFGSDPWRALQHTLPLITERDAYLADELPQMLKEQLFDWQEVEDALLRKLHEIQAPEMDSWDDNDFDG